MYSIYTILHASRNFPPLPPCFAAHSLLKLARRCRFVLRRPRKLEPIAFLLSCMSLAAAGGSSLRSQAIFAGLSRGVTLSKQGLHKRLGPPALAFLRDCLAQSITSLARLHQPMAGLRRILIQDSTCVTLPSRFASLFPGPSNPVSKTQACLRIQCLYDLSAECFAHFGLWPFTRNDQAAASDPLDLIGPRDLLLRDLGYFCLSPMAAIASLGAFFLSRLHMGSLLLDPATQQPLDLLKCLATDRPTDIQALLGAKQLLPVRLLALPLPPALAAARRRKARANRDKRLNHSKAYLRLLGWHLMVTNAPPEILTAPKAAQLYRLRWRIEVIFKSWKSFLGLQCPPSSGIHHALAAIYGTLILATLIHRCMPEIPPNLSLLRICQFVSRCAFPSLLPPYPPPSQHLLLLQILYHCRYEKRSRSNYSHFKSSSLS